MENPLVLLVPDDPIKRVGEFARDLAYGAINGAWESTIVLHQHGNWSHDPTTMIEGKESYSSEEMEFSSKWADEYPSPSLLFSFGYIERIAERGEKGIMPSPQIYALDEFIPSPFEVEYVLTPAAFALLEKPVTPPSVFISYRRSESSALGLLIESRLKRADPEINVFIDKELDPGDKWHGRLETEVRQRPFFVCLLGPTSMGSHYVRNEILWALDEADISGTLIIPICHNGYNFGAKLPRKLQKEAVMINPLVQRLSVHNAIPVFPESADEYEQAMVRLLSRLGYSNI